MKNAFEKLMPDKTLPESTQKKVMQSIHALDAVLQITDLFTVRLISAISSQLSGNGNNGNGDSDKKE